MELEPENRIKIRNENIVTNPILAIPLEKQSIQARETYLNEMNTNSSLNRIDIRSTSGGRLSKSEIVCISDYNARAGTVHINMHIGPIESSIETHNTVPITALHDSGCSKTIMSYELYKRLIPLGVAEIYQDPRYQAVRLASKEVQRIKGVTDINIHFQGENDCTKSYFLNVIVHEGLAQDFFLGRDFTGSEAKAFETNEHIYLTYDHECYLDSIKANLRNKKLCKVPLLSVKEAPVTISNNKAVVIPPYSPVTITCHVTQKPNNGIPLQTKGQSTFEVTQICQPRVKTIAAIYPLINPSNIDITVFNDTPEEYYIPANIEIAQITLGSSMVECHRMQVTEMPLDVEYQYAEAEINVFNTMATNLTDYSTSHNKKLPKNRPIFIEDDEGMTEEEKEMAFLEYMRHGYHHPSMTKIIEEKAALTTLELKSTKKVPEKDWHKLFDLTHLSPQQQLEALDVFLGNKAAFSEHDRDLGCTNLVEMDIELTSDKLQIQAYQPIPHSIRGKVKEILDQLIEYGIVRECNEPSPIVSNLLIVNKKDGKSVRVLLDGRLLNIISKRLPQNLITHPELEVFLNGKQIVTTVDLSDSFFQMPLSLASQPYTAFFSSLHGKRYCFTRCPQGLKNSPLYLKLLMDKLFGDMTDDVIHYADDILIATSGNFSQHLRVVDKALKRITNGKIKIRPQKINLAKEEIDFLGMVWTKGKLSIPRAKTLAFQNLPSPNTPKKAKSVICALSYYRKFVPSFAQLSQPIMDLSLLHPKEFKWTEQHENLFRRLIRKICQNATRYLPNPDKPYFVQTDASAFCGAGKLFQKDEEGNELLIACVSRTFTKTERSYSTIKKEVLALLYTLRTMDFYIRFSKHLTILTDAQGILFLSMCKDSQGILLRFSLELSKYQAEIIHVPGENNETADVLSRHHADIEKIQQEEGIQKPLSEDQACKILEKLKLKSGTRFTREEVATLLDVPSLPNPVPKKTRKSTAKTGTRIIKNTPKTLSNRKVKAPKTSMKRPGIVLPVQLNSICTTQWRAGTKTNRQARQAMKKVLRKTDIQMNNVNTMSYNDFKTVSKAILTGILTPTEFKQAQAQDPFCTSILNDLNKYTRFTLIDGLLFFKSGNNIKLVLPHALLDIVITAKHYSIFGLHFSKTRMERDINARYYIPHNVLSDKLKTLRDNCLVCQFNTTEKKDHFLRSTDYVHAPRATWGVDLIPNLPLSEDGYKAALLAVDLFTGYVQLCPIKDRTTKTLINAIQRTIINPFGIPKFLRTDEEPGLFRSQEFYDFLKPLGTKFMPTSVGAPWANSNAERSIRTIKEAMRKFFLQEKVEEKWDQYAHFFTNAHNRSTGIYGFAPEELMFAYQMPNQNDLLQFWPGTRSHSDYMEKIIPLAEKNRQLASDRGEKKREKDRSYKNIHRVSKEFKLGQIVAHRQLQLATGVAMGMKPKHIGPYIITEINPDGCSATIEHLYNGHVMQAHFTNLQVVSFHAGVGNRVDRNFDDRLIDMLSKKSTLLSKSKRELDISTDFESTPNTEYATQEDETEIENFRDIDSHENKRLQQPDFGRLKDTENVEEWLSNRSETEDENGNETNNSIQSFSHMNESQITNDPNLTYDLFNTCPLCELENASIDPNCSNIEQHPIIQEFVQKLVKKIRKDVIKLRKEIELAEQTIEQIKNDTIDVNTKTNNWLNDSYNLLFHNGKIRRTQSEYSISSQSRENSFQNETIASLSSQNTDSSMRKGEHTLNTDSLCNSPEMGIATCTLGQKRKLKDESQKNNPTSLTKESIETPFPMKNQPQKERGTTQDRIKSPVQVWTGKKIRKTTSLNDLSPCRKQTQSISLNTTQSLEILDSDSEKIHFQPQKERTSTPYPDEPLNISTDED